MKKQTRAGFFLILFSFFFILWGSLAKAEESSETIRVLIPLMNDNGFVTYENGVFSGYYIDYLSEIAKYTGWKYEFSPVSSYEELEQACNLGEFDIMPGIIYSKEYDDLYFDYPGYSIGAKRYVLSVPMDTMLMPDKEYSFLRGIRIGVADNSSNKELVERFKNFCFMHGLDCAEEGEGRSGSQVNFVPIGAAEWREQLKNGYIDGILTSDVFCLTNEMYAIAAFGLDQIYMVAPNGRQKIIDQLNDAIGKINNFYPDFNDSLYERYFSAIMQHKVSFNEKEKQFLQKKRSWKVSMVEDLAPYSYINAKGEPTGLIVEVLKQISDKTEGNIQFEYQYYNTVKEALGAQKSGDCDICGFSLNSQMFLQDRSERSSVSFYSDHFNYYKNNGSLPASVSRKAVLMPEIPSSIFDSIGAEKFELIETASTIEACLDEVNSGKSACTALLSRSGDYYISYNAYNNMKNYEVPNGEALFCFRYAGGMEQTGIDIIDKCLTVMDQEMLNQYVTSVSLFEHKTYTLKDYIESHLELFGLVVAVIMLLIIAFLILIIVYVTRNSKKINDLLYRDEVTGGMSFKLFLEKVKSFKVPPKQKKLLLYSNITSFKYINDVFGYDVGNQLLNEFSFFIKNKLKDAPFSRIYADRYVAVIPYKNQEAAKQAILKILDEFEELCRKKFVSFNVWTRVGAYEYEEGDDIHKAINFANYALDEIGSSSRNECVFYDEEMHNRVLLQKNVEKDMRPAMENGEFEAFYQPKYNIETEELVGAEALVRWRHPQKGLLSPALFIPIFEKNNYILQVDFYIFECVCRLLVKLEKEGKELFPISSNFSRRHLDQPDFIERLTKIVEKYQVQPRFLEIEITETVATNDFDVLIETVKKLKEKGFLVSIDDFGSGYSSIQLLYKLPIDVLKFDKVFVDNENVSNLEGELVDSIISVSRKNGIKVICEGVETKEQEDFVRRHNCIYVQGFLYSKPLPEEEFIRLLG